MKFPTLGAAILLALGTTACTPIHYDRYGYPTDATPSGKHYQYQGRVPPMDPNRTIVMVDCRGPWAVETSANLHCNNY